MSKQLQHRPTFKYKSNNLFSSNIHTRFSTRMTKQEISQVVVFIEDNKIILKGSIMIIRYGGVLHICLKTILKKTQAFFLTNEHINIIPYFLH